LLGWSKVDPKGGGFRRDDANLLDSVNALVKATPDKTALLHRR
jgi:hypothetical protein